MFYNIVYTVNNNQWFATSFIMDEVIWDVGEIIGFDLVSDMKVDILTPAEIWKLTQPAPMIS